MTWPREPGTAVGAGTAWGGLQTSLGKNVLSKGGLQPPPGRGPAAAVFWAGGAPRGGVPTRPTQPRGATTPRRDPERGDQSRLLDRLHQRRRRLGAVTRPRSRGPRWARGPPGGCKRALERTVLFKGGLQPPLGRRDHEAPRPQDGTGSTRSAGGCVRPATSAGSRTRRTRAGACGRGAASLAAGDDPRGQGGHRETARGLQTSLGKNVLFKGGLQPPRAVQGSKPFSNGLAPRSPATRARISSKAAAPAESQGKAADWRCIRAQFPVRNQVIP